MGRTSFGEVQPLIHPTHRDLNYIGRCVHIDDVVETVQKGYLVPQRLTNSIKTLSREVLWFAPRQSMSTHNYFGNATFVVKWETVLQKLGPNLYLIDQAIYNSRSYTRIVLTSTNYDRSLAKVDLHLDDSALSRSDTGFRHVNHCFNKRQYGLHELQIAIEVDKKDARWLLYSCRLFANDHSLANTLFSGTMPRKGKGGKYESYKCFKFNTAQNKKCDYDFNVEESRDLVKAEILKKINPALKPEAKARIKTMAFAPSLTPGESLEAIFHCFLTLLKQHEKNNTLPMSSVTAKMTSPESPSVNSLDARSGVQRMKHSLESRLKPSGHPLAAKPSGHPLAAKPSGHPLAAKPSGHPLAAKPSGHSLAAKTSGHSMVAKPSANSLAATIHHPLPSGTIENPLSRVSSARANAVRSDAVRPRAETLTYSDHHVGTSRHEVFTNPVSNSSSDSSSSYIRNVALRAISAKTRAAASGINIPAIHKESEEASSARHSLAVSASSRAAVPAARVAPLAAPSVQLPSRESRILNQKSIQLELFSPSTKITVKAPNKERGTSTKATPTAVVQFDSASKLVRESSVTRHSFHPRSATAQSPNYKSYVSNGILIRVPAPLSSKNVLVRSTSHKLQGRSAENRFPSVEDASVAFPVSRYASTGVSSRQASSEARLSSLSVSAIPASSSSNSLYCLSDNLATDAFPVPDSSLASLVSSPPLCEIAHQKMSVTSNESRTISSICYRSAPKAPAQSSLPATKESAAARFPRSAAIVYSNYEYGRGTSSRTSASGVSSSQSRTNNSVEGPMPEARTSLSHKLTDAYKTARPTSSELHFAALKMSSRNAVPVPTVRSHKTLRATSASDDLSGTSDESFPILFRIFRQRLQEMMLDLN